MYSEEQEENCYATKISLSPDMEELKKLQLNDRVIGRVLLELETVPRKEQFTGHPWSDHDFNRFKQIQSQLLLHNGVLLRS